MLVMERILAGVLGVCSALAIRQLLISVWGIPHLEAGVLGFGIWIVLVISTILVDFRNSSGGPR